MAKPASLEDFTPEQIEQMAATYHGILNNPETRSLALQATKKINPELSIPELDLEARTRAGFQAIDKKNQELEQQIRERDAKDRIREARSGLKEQGFTNDDVSAIEKIMMDEHIPSYETAAKYYKGQRTIAEPTPNMGPATTFNMPADPLAALKGGKQALNRWGREAATAALDDLRSGRIKLTH